MEPLQRRRQAGGHIAELVAGETEGGHCLRAAEGVRGQAGVAQLVVVEVHGPEGSQAPATSPALASPPPRAPAQGRLQSLCVCVCVCVCMSECVWEWCGCDLCGWVGVAVCVECMCEFECEYVNV